MHDGVRIRARQPSAAVIQRVVEKTQVGKRKVTKYYTTLDPNPINMTMFDTYGEAAAYETRLLAARSSSPATGKGPATPATEKSSAAAPEKSKVAATTAAATAPPATTSVSGTTATKPTVPAKDAAPAPTTTSAVSQGKTSAPVMSATKVVEPPTWEELWYAKQAEVVNAMSPFVPRFRALDPGCALRIRGSLASGFKGAHKALDSGERPLFNPKDFDIDAYVVSDLLYEQAIAEARTSDAAAKGKLPGSNHAKVNAIIRELRVALAKIPGNRDSKQTFRFNVIIRSSRNAAFVEGGDADDLFELGYNYAGFVGVPAPAADAAKDRK